MIQTLRNIFFILLLPSIVSASPWIGGYISMQQISKGANPTYEFTLNLFVDYFNTTALQDFDLRNNTQRILIAQKSGHQFKEYLDLNFKNTLEIPFANPICAQSRALGVRIYRFSLTKQLDRSLYADTAGYYLAWERCCRNALLANVAQPAQAGLVLYSEFPALLFNGADVNNSLPNLTGFLGDYFCKDIEKKVALKFNDTDGDKLQYSLIKPRKGHNGISNFDAIAQPGAFDDISWASGYGTNNITPGPKALYIDKNTGVLGLQSNTNGLFTFTMLVEELRGDVNMGKVELTLQLVITNCNFPPATNSSISFLDGTVSPKTTCGIDIFSLTTPFLPNLNYQWQKDGVNIFNQKNTTLGTNDPGIYTLLFTSQNSCTNEATSNSLTINKLDDDLKMVSSSKLICDSEPLLITNSVNKVVDWYKGGIFFSTANQISVIEAGLYSLKSQNSPCSGFADSVRVSKYSFPANLYSQMPSNLNLCESLTESISVNNNADLTYKWYRNGVAIANETNNLLTIVQEGAYFLQLSNISNSCIKSLDTLLFIKPNNCISFSPNFLHNAFSPNADGINDLLEFKFTSLNDSVIVTVYDRWGGEIYAMPLSSFAWDGTLINGDIAPAGIYSVIFFDKIKEIKHTITLLR